MLKRYRARAGALALFAGLALVQGAVLQPTLLAQSSQTLQQIVTQVTTNEHDAAQEKPPYLYTSSERSERTKGHLWVERVADIPDGKLRLLVAEDGHSISTDRRKAEVERLEGIASNPHDFLRHEQIRKNDEQHAQQMLALLPHAFLFSSAGDDGSWLRINYRPNPDYVPRTYEERVLHGMTGTLVIDSRHFRLHYLEGHLDNDVTFAYGLLATVKSGSRFSLTRNLVPGGVWKTTSLSADLNGRIILAESVGRQQQSEHRDFVPLPRTCSIQQAVAILVQ